MSEDKKNLPAGTNGDETDIIENRRIFSVPAEHTPQASETVHIPGDDSDELKIAGGSRFIKTGETPFISVHGEAQAQEAQSDVDKYSDRLTARPAERR